jgi:hypothetical protein
MKPNDQLHGMLRRPQPFSVSSVLLMRGALLLLTAPSVLKRKS